MLRYLLWLSLCVMFSTPCLGGIVLNSKYSYDQDGVMSFDGSDDVPGNIDQTVTLPNAVYTFDLDGTTESFYELKSQTKFEVNIDGRAIDGFSGDGWSSTTVTASNSTQLVDTAIVEGIAGQTSGVVEFLWGVTGASGIKVDSKLTSDAYVINELFTTALFNTLDENAVPELLLNDQSSPGIGTSNIDSSVPGFFAPVSIFVDWFVGEELDVFFELETSAKLSIMNLDAAGFEATLVSDFGNTATMQAVNIYDQDGVLIEDARLVGEGGFVYDPGAAAVPEPSSTSVLLLGICCFAAKRRR